MKEGGPFRKAAHHMLDLAYEHVGTPGSFSSTYEVFPTAITVVFSDIKLIEVDSFPS